MNKKIRILFLTHYYPPETGGASARISGLTKWLAKYGHDVSVITGYPNYPMGEIYPGYESSSARYEVLDGVKVFRAKVIAGSYKSIVVRLLNYFTLFVTSLWIGIKKRNNFDIIVASSPPLTIGLLGRLLSKIYKIPWILDIRDIWPDVGIEAGIIKEYSIVDHISGKLAKFLYRHSNHITPVTLSKKNKIVGYGVEEAKISVVENGVDSDIVQNAENIDWRSKYRLDGKFVLTYAGLIGKAQGVEYIIETADLLRDQKDIHFLIVGEGVNKKDLIERASKLELTNITFIDLQPKEAIPSLLKTSDIGLVPLINDNLKDAIPSKLLEAWSCKLPVILIAGGEAKEIITRIEGGVALNSGDPEIIKNVIIDFIENREKLKTFGMNGYTYVHHKLERKYLARKLERVILKVLNK